MKRILTVLAIFAFASVMRAQTMQLPAGFTARASGAATFPFGGNPVVPSPQTFVSFPATIATLGVTVHATGTSTNWTAQIEQAPSNTGPWTVCGSVVTISANGINSGTCTPSGSYYLELVIVAGCGGGLLRGTDYGQSDMG